MLPEYLRGQEKDNKECAGLFKDYQKCLHVRSARFMAENLLIMMQAALKERGVDKLLNDAREDNKENDARLMGPKSKSLDIFDIHLIPQRQHPNDSHRITFYNFSFVCKDLR